MSKTIWVVALAALALVIVVVLAGVFTSFGYGGGMMGSWGMGPGIMGGYGFPPLGMLVPIIFLVLIVAGVVWLAQALARGGTAVGPGGATESPLEILKRRYARGEITKDQFEELKRDLGVG